MTNQFCIFYLQNTSLLKVLLRQREWYKHHIWDTEKTVSHLLIEKFEKKK